MSSQLFAITKCDNEIEVKLSLNQLNFDHNRVKIVCIVGPARTGKSFLLNVVAGRENLFSVERKESLRDSATVGTQISNCPIELNNTEFYAIEVEGIDHRCPSYNTEMCQSVVAVADVVLLNIRGLPGRYDMFNLLKRFVNDNCERDKTALSHLIIVVRDLICPVSYETEYLADLLKHEVSTTPTAVENNRIRDALQKRFQSVNIISLPFPSYQVFAFTDELTFDLLSANFTHNVNQLKQLIAEKIGNGVDRSNDHSTMPSTLENLQKFQNLAVKQTMKYWAQHCPLPPIPQNHTRLHQLLQTRFDEAKRELNKRTIGMIIDTTDIVASVEVEHANWESQNDDLIMAVGRETFESFRLAKLANPMTISSTCNWIQEFSSSMAGAFANIYRPHQMPTIGYILSNRKNSTLNIKQI